MLHHLKIPEGFGAWILTHRAGVLAVYGLVTVAALAACWGVPVRVSILHGLMPDETRYRAYLERASMLGGDSDDLLYVATREGDRLLTPQVLNRIRAAARELERLPEIDRVFSIVDAPRLVGDGKKLSSREVAARAVVRRRLAEGRVPDLRQEAIAVEQYWPESEDLQRRIDLTALRDSMRKDPIAGRLLSRDGTAETMLVWLAESSSLYNKPESGIRREIEDVLHQAQLGAGGTFCAGTLVIQDWMFDEVIRAFVLVLPVVTLIVCMLVYVIFRRLSYVLLTLAIAAIAIVWALGVVSAVFGEITLLVAATPALILILSTADTIHLASAYVAELKRGISGDEAIRKVFRDVGGACVLTSLTTFIGFLSLMVVPAVTLRHMAVACAVGVAGALLLALTLVPITLTVVKPPPVERASRSPFNRSLAAAVQGCRHLSLTYPRSVVVAHVLVIVGSVMLAWRLDYDADLPARFAPTHPLRRSIDFFNRQMFGTTTIEVIVHTDPEEVLAPATLTGLADFQRRLFGQPEVQDVISIVTVLRIVDDLVGLNSPDGLPKTKAAAAATVELARRTSPDAIDGLVSEEAGLSRVAVQVAPTRVLAVLRYAERIAAMARESLPPGTGIETSGYYSVVGTAVREVLRSQVEGFVICFITVMVVVTLGVRSVRLGLLAVLPNVLPLALLGGILGLTFDVVDSDFLGIAIVSFGLAVDDTIHFLHRYDIERADAPSRKVALERTFDYTGSAILRTTVILGIGLLPFSLSGYLSIRVLGTYMVFVLGCAVLGDILLLPALILLFGGENGGKRSDGSEACCAADASGASGGSVAGASSGLSAATQGARANCPRQSAQADLPEDPESPDRV